jgi:hypothetical protein
MEQMRPTQFRYHQVLHDDRRRALRGCDDRTYAHLCRSQAVRERPGLLRRLARATWRAVRPRVRRRVPGAPGPATAADEVLVLPADEPVVCIDLGNPLAAPTRPGQRAAAPGGRRPGGQN